jgi:hypothetical protein
LAVVVGLAAFVAGDEAAETEAAEDGAEDWLEGGEAAAPETDVAFEIGP